MESYTNLQSYKSSSNKLSIPFETFELLYSLFVLVYTLIQEVKPMWNNANIFTKIKSALKIMSYLTEKGIIEKIEYYVKAIFEKDKTNDLAKPEHTQS